MKILIVHNEYVIKGGEESAVANEQAALTKLGHDVSVHTVKSSSINTNWKKAKTFFSSIYSVRHRRIITAKLRAFQPDIVHVHNFMPILSPSIFYACRAEKVPCVLTLHNYRILCPSTVLFFEGDVFMDGVNGKYLSAFLKRVYRDSYLGTLSIILTIVIHRWLNTWKIIDQIVVLSRFQNNLISEKLGRELVTLQNFVSLEQTPPDTNPVSDHFIYVGRLSEEKGINQLIKIWPHDKQLIIVGSGPLEPEIRRISVYNKNINPVGQKSKKEVLELISTSQALIFPSVVHETFGLVTIESFAVGTPVLFNNIEPISEVVKPHKLGESFQITDPSSLSTALNEVVSNREQMSRNCRNEFKKRYAEKPGVSRLETLFKQTIKDKREGKRPTTGFE